jgi:recombinational DNA repair protein (RecF pathway)
MSYKTYITEALICGSSASNTSDKSFLLFTREAGMLYATAKSVREERSKQRYALQEFSYVRSTLVHGKSGWRLTGAEPLTNAYTIQTRREARALIRNTVRLLRRLVQGEIPHERIFDDVKKVLTYCHTDDEALLEEILTLRTLNALGYTAPHNNLQVLIDTDTPFHCVSGYTPEIQAHCKKVIEMGLHESQL